MKNLMGGAEERNSIEMPTKQEATDAVVREVRESIKSSGLQDFFDTVKDKAQNFMSDLKEGSFVKAFQNLFSEVKQSQTAPVETQQNVYQPATEYLSDISLEGVDMSKEQMFSSFLEYMQHQQGAGGAFNIVQNIVFNRPIPANVLSNMRNNIGKDFPGGAKNLNGITFTKYRYKKFIEKYKEFAHKKLPYEDAIDEVAAQYGQPKEIIKTMIGIESTGDIYANKGKDSVYKGLMQVNIRHVKKYGVTDIYDPKQNMMMAMKLRQENAPQLKKLTNDMPTLIAKLDGSEYSNAA